MNTGSMVTLKMSKKIGVIAEDASDVAVISEIFLKYMKDSEFSVKHFKGNGCGKLRSKCGSWAAMLSKSGCENILIFHDLDRNDEKVLRKDLLSKIDHAHSEKSIIIVPVEELEAWLLSDEKAIKEVFRLTKAPKKINDCEAVKSPKEHLRKLVWALGKKRYLNTRHNQKIASKAEKSNFLRCKSYTALDTYIREVICA